MNEPRIERIVFLEARPWRIVWWHEHTQLRRTTYMHCPSGTTADLFASRAEAELALARLHRLAPAMIGEVEEA